MTRAFASLRRTAALWGGGVLALAILLHQGVRALGPDTWLALGAGNLIRAHGIPQDEPWTQWGIYAWVDQQWLGQWLIALAHAALGNMATLLALGILPAAAALVIAARTAHHLGARTWAIGVMLPVGALALAPFIMVRPQTLVFPLFALALDVIIRGRERPERLWLLVPLLILWANIHGTALFATALALAGVAWARHRTGAAPKGDRGWTAALYGAIALSPMVSPLILDLPAYYARMLSPGGAAALADEWQPLNAATDPILALLVVGAGVAIAKWTPRTLPLALLAVGSALATLVVVRFGPWLALTMCVVAPMVMSNWRARWLRARHHAIWVRLTDGTIALCVAALAVGYAGTTLVGLPARAAQLAPADAAAAAIPTGTVLADLQTANWLLTTRPDRAGHVVIDARLERYTRDQLVRAVQATQGLRPVRREDADVIVLGGTSDLRRERVARMGNRVTTLYADDAVTVLAVHP